MIKIKRLKLSRETVRNLTSRDLALAQGGQIASGAGSGCATCGTAPFPCVTQEYTCGQMLCVTFDHRCD